MSGTKEEYEKVNRKYQKRMIGVMLVVCVGLILGGQYWISKKEREGFQKNHQRMENHTNSTLGESNRP